MEAVQELYHIMVSIPNTFINTLSIIKHFHRRNGLLPCGQSWAYQIQRSTCSFQSHTPYSVSAQSYVQWSIILLPVQSQMQNASVMSTSQWSTLKVWWRSTYIIIKVCNKYIALFLSSYKLLTGDSTDPISLPPHHSTLTLVETPAVTEVNMPIWVTSYIPSKSAKPLKSLNDSLKPQKPEAPLTQPLSTSPPLPPPHQLQGRKKPPKVASAEELSFKKVTKQQKTKGTTKDDAKAKDKGKGKVVNSKASKFQQQGKY